MTPINNSQLPPHNIAAEEALLGAIILDDKGLSEITLKDADFYHEPHSLIFRSMLELAKSKTHIDQITLEDELNRVGKLEICGGVAYLIHLVGVCPSPLEAVYYADIVKRLSIARQLIEAGREIEEIGYSNPGNMTAALAICDEKLLNVRKIGIASPIITPKERAELLYDRYSELHKKEMVMALHTGIPKLDRLLGGGIYNGDMVVVGARTSVGKTTFLRFLADQFSQDCNVLFCSIEMNMQSISDREVAQSIGISINQIRIGNYSDETYSKILTAIGDISNKRVYLYDEIPMTTDKILQAAFTMKLRHSLGAVVIDYLGILGDNYGKNSYERISYISRKVKELARTLDVPVIVAHQLNRETEKREDKRPQLHDLRDSGSIEQDADVVLFLYRESYYDSEKEKQAITRPGE